MPAPFYMPLYIADYLADTHHLSMEQHGLYFLLLMLHWQTGPLPDDDRYLARSCGVDLRQFRRSKPVVMRFFQLTKDGWIQKRLMREREHALEIAAKRSEAGKQKGKQKLSNSSPNAQQLLTYSIDEASTGSKSKPVEASAALAQAADGRVVRFDGARARRLQPDESAGPPTLPACSYSAGFDELLRISNARHQWFAEHGGEDDAS